MTSPITRKEADEIRERAKKATPGPWEWKYSEDGGVHQLELAHIVIDGSENDGLPGAYDDMDFIASARTNLPRVLDELEKLKALTAEILRRDYWLRSANVKAVGPVDVVEANVKRTLEHLRELTEGF